MVDCSKSRETTPQSLKVQSVTRTIGFIWNQIASETNANSTRYVPWTAIFSTKVGHDNHQDLRLHRRLLQIPRDNAPNTQGTKCYAHYWLHFEPNRIGNERQLDEIRNLDGHFWHQSRPWQPPRFTITSLIAQNPVKQRPNHSRYKVLCALLASFWTK